MKKAFSTQQISYIAIASLLLILGAQAYLVNEYFQTTREGLIRESDAILKEAFREKLTLIFTPCVRKPMVSAASLMPSIDTPSRVRKDLSLRVCRV